MTSGASSGPTVAASPRCSMPCRSPCAEATNASSHSMRRPTRTWRTRDPSGRIAWVSTAIAKRNAYGTARPVISAWSGRIPSPPNFSPWASASTLPTTATGLKCAAATCCGALSYRWATTSSWSTGSGARVHGRHSGTSYSNGRRRWARIRCIRTPNTTSEPPCSPCAAREASRSMRPSCGRSVLRCACALTSRSTRSSATRYWNRDKPTSRSSARSRTRSSSCRKWWPAFGRRLTLFS